MAQITEEDDLIEEDSPPSIRKSNFFKQEQAAKGEDAISGINWNS